MANLKAHRSIRKYKSRVIPEEILTDILVCGIRASNTGNMQLYSIIITRNSYKKALLAPLHFNQRMVIEAPILLTICIDFNRFSIWCEQNSTQADFSDLLWLINGTIDFSLLAQNICVAAEDHGLGICYLGTTLYNALEICKILKLPKGVVPITALSIGYPELIPELNDRLSLDSIVHFEEYMDYSAERISDIYRYKENLESTQSFIKENGKQNLAQVFTEVRYKKEDSVYFSEKLFLMLKEQGFLIK